MEINLNPGYHSQIHKMMILNSEITLILEWNLNTIVLIIYLHLVLLWELLIVQYIGRWGSFSIIIV